MSRELLKQALVLLSWVTPKEGKDPCPHWTVQYKEFICSVQDELAKPDEPVGYASISELERLKDNSIAGRPVFISKNAEDTRIAIYTHPPRQQKPLSDHDIFAGYDESKKSDTGLGNFMFGVKFAERSHGVGGGEISLENIMAVDTIYTILNFSDKAQARSIIEGIISERDFFKDALDAAIKDSKYFESERDKLEAINTELVNALKMVLCAIGAEESAEELRVYLHTVDAKKVFDALGKESEIGKRINSDFGEKLKQGGE